METLIDGDLASNNGGWQWSASTGVDPAPYFRIFNPYTQSQKVRPHPIPGESRKRETIVICRQIRQEITYGTLSQSWRTSVVPVKHLMLALLVQILTDCRYP